MRYLLIIACFLLVHSASTQSIDWQAQTRKAAYDLVDLVSLPNDGRNRGDIDRNHQWLKSAFSRRGFETTVLETSGNPLLLATHLTDPAKPTVLFYMHIDGQPVDPTKWDQPDPYQAVLKKVDATGQWQTIDLAVLEGDIDPEWRLFGRSAADDKAPIIAFLHAVDVLQSEGKSFPYNLKVILDGEEEMGSSSLAGAVDRYRDQLAADLLLIHDGPVHLSGDPTLIFGCRGIFRLDLTVYGPSKPQHSGHYGNYAPNPVFRMAHLLSSMKDEDGRVTIDGYYDGIELDATTRSLLAKVPDDESAILDLLDIAKAESVGTNYQESLQYPSFNVRGISAGWVGAQARTIVPDLATAAIDIRLVPESDPQHLVNAITRHIEAQGYHIVDHEPTEAERQQYEKLVYLYHGKAVAPFRTDLQHPAGDWLGRSIAAMYGQEPIRIRMMGGTVPITAMVRQLGIPAIIVPMVNPDNNQHSPNENMRLGHLTNALKTFYGIFTQPYVPAK